MFINLPAYRLPLKLWLLGTALVVSLLAAACSPPAGQSTVAPTSGPDVLSGPPGGPEYSAILVTSDLAVGTNRVSFGIIDRDGMPVRTPQAQVQAVYLPPGKDQGEVHQTATAQFIQWPPPGERGVYVTTLDFDVPAEGTDAQPGLWALQITTTTSDGKPVEAQTAMTVREKPVTPAIGSPAPASVTPTASEVDDLVKITTDKPPDPDLYQLSIDEALKAGKPLVVVFASPAFCVSATCGPQVKIISQIKDRYKGQANFIHVEVFKDPHLIEGGRPGEDRVVPAVKEWGLPTEPWTFVMDREGEVHAKFEQFTTEEEIEQALREVL